MRVSSKLPPLTAENESLHRYIDFLETMLRLLLASIDAGDFDNPDQRTKCTESIRMQIL